MKRGGILEDEAAQICIILGYTLALDTVKKKPLQSNSAGVCFIRARSKLYTFRRAGGSRWFEALRR